MKRRALAYLKQWVESPDRKPLIIRGARQVGKTWLARYFVKNIGKQLIEINFEKQPHLKSLFSSNDPKQIVKNIEAAIKQTITAEECVLFLDEIQVVPEILAKCRWFYEDMPELPVIIAGSLLEFILQDHEFSMPVGRISYLHLEPLSFEEFLLANDEMHLYQFINDFQWENGIPELLHQQLMKLFKEYIIVGGMPAAVSSWIKQKSLEQVNHIHYELFATYRDDFSKYSKKIENTILEESVLAVSKMVGQKFVYSRISQQRSFVHLKEAIDLLEKARLCHKVNATAANGIPLGAEMNNKYFKCILLDVGLVSAQLGINLNQIESIEEIDLINQGGISEQVVGQLLRCLFSFYIEPKLYCWSREKKGAEAEIDYVIQHQQSIIPVEVKSGSAGSLKSLHIYMAEKEFDQAIRINANFPRIENIDSLTPSKKTAKYQLLSLPFYLLEQLHRLIKLEASKNSLG